MEISSYSSIFALGHRALQPLLEQEDLLIEEKIDGSQIGFGSFAGELKARSKGAIIEPEAPMKMFALGIQTAKNLQPKLHDGWTYRGEFLMKPKHNIWQYNSVPPGHIIIFDITTDQGEFLSYEDKEKEAARLGLSCVPLLHRGQIDLELFRSLLDRESCLGGPKIEGIVIKPANYNLWGTDKKVLMGKYVSEAFKESHALEWKASNPSQNGIIQAISTALRTDARWNKAIQHLREKGELTDTPRDIGPLVREIKEDLKREEYDNVAQSLVKHFWGDIERAVVRGVPEFYKEQLAESAFQFEEAQASRDPEDVPAWRLTKAS